MSTASAELASSYSPRFRPEANWHEPVETSFSDMLDQNFHLDHSESNDTPPSSAASMASSPSHSSIMTDNDLRRHRSRQRSQAPGGSRARQLSISSYHEGSPAPVGVMEPTTLAMPVYTSTPATMALLPEPIPSTSSSHYIPGFASLMNDHPGHHQHHTYGPSSYHQPLHRPHGYGMPVEYHNHYTQSHNFNSVSTHHNTPRSHRSSLAYSSAASLRSSTSSPALETSRVKVVQSRPKPRCWDHGCNGRQFSTFSNLLRHQREKSGHASKATCPNCGAEFTRTTARNGHLLHDKCKRRT